jgi:hypothetical protein
MDIARRQQLPFTLLEPADAGVALTSWAVPVATRNGELSITCLMVSNSLWRVGSPRQAISWDSKTLWIA